MTNNVLVERGGGGGGSCGSVILLKPDHLSELSETSMLLHEKSGTGGQEGNSHFSSSIIDQQES